MKTNKVKLAALYLLGVLLIMAGVGHLSFQRIEFRAQVPPWLPLNADFVVIASGIVEISLGLALIFLKKHRTAVGWIAAIFFLAVFPGNIAQLVEHRNAFGLDTDLKKWIRLPFQPILILWALWSTGAWAQYQNNKKKKAAGAV